MEFRVVNIVWCLNVWFDNHFSKWTDDVVGVFRDIFTPQGRQSTGGFSHLDYFTV